MTTFMAPALSFRVKYRWPELARTTPEASPSTWMLANWLSSVSLTSWVR